MEIYLLILIALIVYCCIRFDDTQQQIGGSGEIDYRTCREDNFNPASTKCGEQYKVILPKYVQKEDPLIRYGRHPWEKPKGVACRSNVQCQSGNCDGYFCM